MTKKIECCRICENKKLVPLINLGNQSLTGIFAKNLNEEIIQSPLNLVKCHGNNGCGLVQLLHSCDKYQMYGENYGYRSGLNSSMVNHLKSKVEKILKLNLLKKGDLIIDIGSNDATTLKSFPNNDYQLVGVDPTGKYFSSHYKNSIKLVDDFFSREVMSNYLADAKAKVITSFSMFYDLENPIEFAKDIEYCLDDEGIWVFEQSYLTLMLKKNSFDTICHEHLEYYSLKQIIWILDRANMKVLDVEFNNINGGSFSITAAKKDSSYKINLTTINKIIKDEKTFGLENLDVYRQFEKRINDSKVETLSFLSKMKYEGKKISGLGASTKGNVLLQYYGIDNKYIDNIGEVNEEKFGSFTPGTLIPIIPEDEMLKKTPDYIFVLPWHFKEFFLKLSKLKGKKLIFPLPKFEVIEA